MQQRVRKANTPNDIAAIPDICPFWYTATLFRPVHQKVRKLATKQPNLVKMGQNFAFSMLKSTPARKKYATSGCVVGTNITYDRRHHYNFPPDAII